MIISKKVVIVTIIMAVLLPASIVYATPLLAQIFPSITIPASPPAQHCLTRTGGYLSSKWNLSQVSPSFDVIDSARVYHSRLVNTGTGFNGSFYAIAQQGGAPDLIPSSPDLYSSRVNLISTQIIYNNVSFSAPANDQVELYIGLYFWFSQPKTTSLGTGQLLDTQARVSSNRNGAYFPVGHISNGFLTNPSRFTYREVIGSLQPGQNTTVTNFNVTSYYGRALAQLGIPNTGSMNLTRIETGAEGYGVNYVNSEWCYALVSTSPISVAVQRPLQGTTFNYGYVTLQLSSALFSGTMYEGITPVYLDSLSHPLVAYQDGTYNATVILSRGQVRSLTLKIWVSGGTPLGTTTYTIASTDPTDFPAQTLTVTVT